MHLPSVITLPMESLKKIYGCKDLMSRDKLFNLSSKLIMEQLQNHFGELNSVRKLILVGMY